MRTILKILCGLVFFASPAAARDVTVVFIVQPPEQTPADAELFICGSHPLLGNWSGSGLKLKRTDGGDWRGQALLPAGRAIEFKVTRGDWSTVEKDERGSDIANRTITVGPPTDSTDTTKPEDAALKQVVRLKVARWADDGKTGPRPTTERRSTKTGDIRVHASFKSEILGNRRDIYVYLPPGYAVLETQRFPVLYMHDGQNLFDAATSFIGIEWRADEHAQRLIETGRIKPLIIVGIANTPDRMNEYTPDRDESRGTGGRASDYARFLVEEVKPFIDQTYRTKPGRAHAGVAGSSLGGLVSLSICMEYPQTFSMCGVISPALMWNDGALLRQIEAGDKAWMKRMRFWVDMGTREGRQIEALHQGIARTRELISILDRAGLSPGRDYYYQEVYEGEHNEAAWAERFDKILLYFFAR